MKTLITLFAFLTALTSAYASAPMCHMDPDDVPFPSDLKDPNLNASISSQLFDGLLKKGCEIESINMGGSDHRTAQRINFLMTSDNPGPIHFCTLGSCIRIFVPDEDTKTFCEIF